MKRVVIINLLLILLLLLVSFICYYFINNNSNNIKYKKLLINYSQSSEEFLITDFSNTNYHSFSISNFEKENIKYQLIIKDLDNDREKIFIKRNNLNYKLIINNSEEILDKPLDKLDSNIFDIRTIGVNQTVNYKIAIFLKDSISINDNSYYKCKFELKILE